jgi:hypothetical protein
MRDLLYFVIGILLGLICVFFDGSAVMAQSTSTAAGIAYAVERDWLIISGGLLCLLKIISGRSDDGARRELAL